jgi:hypothetical protein
MTRYDACKLAVESGHIFTVTFTKRTNGEIRTMTCRTGVRKHLKGGPAAYNFKSKNLLSVYDMQSRGYRCIPVDAIIEMKISGKIYKNFVAS